MLLVNRREKRIGLGCTTMYLRRPWMVNCTIISCTRYAGLLEWILEGANPRNSIHILFGTVP